jgi:hypothetical protein
MSAAGGLLSRAILLHLLGLAVGLTCVAFSVVVVAFGGAHGVTGVIALLSAVIGAITAIRAAFGATERWHREACRCPFCNDVAA